MADHTSVEPEQVRSVNSRIRACGSRFGAAASKFVSTAQQYEGCWGNDEFGQQFAKGYKEGADKMIEAANGLPDNVNGAATGIDNTVEVLEQTDQNNASSL